MLAIITGVIGALVGAIITAVSKRYGRTIVAGIKNIMILSLYKVLNIRDPNMICSCDQGILYITIRSRGVKGIKIVNISAMNSFRIGISQGFTKPLKLETELIRLKLELPVLPIPRKAKLIYRNKLGFTHSIMTDIL